MASLFATKTLLDLPPIEDIDRRLRYGDARRNRLLQVYLNRVDRNADTPNLFMPNLEDGAKIRQLGFNGVFSDAITDTS